MTADLSYYLAAGTITKATLLASASNNWQNFPVQSDQTSPNLGWSEPERADDARPVLPRRSPMGDMSVRDDGFYTWGWHWRFWTTGQLSYILATFFGGANVYSNPATAAITVQTWFDSAYVAFNAQMIRPKWKEDRTAEDGGYRDVVLHFVGGVIIT